jgi:hypothetical protein
MARHFYTVTEPFRSIGPAGVRECKVGDEVILDRPARPGRHLQFVKSDDEPFVVAGGGGSGPPTLPSAAEMDRLKAAFEDLRNQLTVAESEGASARTQLAAAQEEVAALRAMLAGGGGSGPPTLPSAAEAPARRRG